MALYDTIEQVIRQHKNNVIVGRVAPHEVRNAIRWVMRNYPDIFWFAHQYHFDEETGVIQLHYTFSKERVESIRQSIDDVIRNDFCLDHVKTLKVHEQVSYVYKWLVTYCNYNVNSAYNQNIYSVFVRRNTVCAGYAKAAQYLFNLLGIESRLVFGRLHNDKSDGRHCWNIVNIDGMHYHFDACLGDSALDTIAQLSGIQHLIKCDGINLNFLCVSTSEILKSRIIEDIDSLPSCEHSWSISLRETAGKIAVKRRKSIQGCLLSDIGSSADIFQCAKDKHTILKVFRPDSKTACGEEYSYMLKIKGCQHMLQCNERYTDIPHDTIAIEQSTPLLDLLCSSYYKLSLKGLIKMAIDIAMAWNECRERGVLYRDIHICNIYRANDGTFKLGDYGSCTTDFSRKEIVGSQWFMAPETFTIGIFTEASAVYSISMVIYFILNDLQPVFLQHNQENEALRKSIHGVKFPLPVRSSDLPSSMTEKIEVFFSKISASSPEERSNKTIAELILELKRLSDDCGDNDYVIYRGGTGREVDFYKSKLLNTNIANDIAEDVTTCFESNVINLNSEVPLTSDNSVTVKIDFDNSKWNFETQNEACAIVADVNRDGCIEPEQSVDTIESFARTMSYVSSNIEYDRAFEATPCNAVMPNELNHRAKIDDEFDLRHVTFVPGIVGQTKQKKSFLRKWLDKKKRSVVYSSIFAPAEISKKTLFQVQVYLHLFEDTEWVRELAQESDSRAERKDYIPLSLKLKSGDKVDIEINIFGKKRLMCERKTLIWQNSFSKCSFGYYVPEDLDIGELYCVTNILVNHALVGEMRFITRIVGYPCYLNSEIQSHHFKRVFISYAHQDASKIKLIALAYKAQGIDYFYDRDSLKPGDVYEEKIFDYIDNSDLFVLCWSLNAAASAYVAKEKGRALLRAYPQLSLKDATLKICPISIEPRAELPSDMKEVYNFEVL